MIGLMGSDLLRTMVRFFIKLLILNICLGNVSM